MSRSSVRGHACSLAQNIRRAEAAAETVVETTLAAIAERDPVLNAFTDVYETSVEDARAVDKTVRGHGDPGPLAGVPFAVKNLFAVAGSPLRAGSLIEAAKPVPTEDAAMVASLRGAGAVLVGATNMDEYAHGFTTDNSHHGVTRNPHDPGRIAGGSSGGSAAAVADGLIPVAMGSDTNGSIRVPASLCGVYGLKPTFGRLSRAGSVLFATSLDHVGPLTTSIADLEQVFDVVDGPDRRDPVSVSPPPDGMTVTCGGDDLRIAVVGGHFRQVVDGQAKLVIDQIAAALRLKGEVELPDSDRACAAASVITAAEAGQRHLAALRTQAAAYDPKVRVGLQAGALVPAAWYLAAQRFRRRYQQRVQGLFEHVDVLLTATTPCAAPAVGQRTMNVDGESLLIGMSLGLLTQPWALAGVPALSIPVVTDGPLPIGVQMIAAPFKEANLFAVGRRLEKLGAVRKPPEERWL